MGERSANNDNKMNHQNSDNHSDTTRTPDHHVSMDRPPVQAASSYMDEMFFTRSFPHMYSSASILFDNDSTPSLSQNRRNITTTTVSSLKRRDCPRYDWRY